MLDPHGHKMGCVHPKNTPKKLVSQIRPLSTNSSRHLIIELSFGQFLYFLQLLKIEICKSCKHALKDHAKTCDFRMGFKKRHNESREF